MSRIKIILIAVAAVALALAAWMLPVKQYTQPFLDWVESLGAWGPVMLSAAYVPATVLFIPGSALTLGAGALFGVVVGTIAVSIGSVAGSTATFLIGRYFARNWVAEKVAGNRRFKAIDDAVGENGFKIVLLTRLSPVFPYNLLGYAYGITRVRLIDYVLASWIGMLPGTVMFVYLGHAAREAAAGYTDKSPAEWALLGVGLIATIAVTIVVTRVARRALKKTQPDAVHG